MQGYQTPSLRCRVCTIDPFRSWLMLNQHLGVDLIKANMCGPQIEHFDYIATTDAE